MQPLDAPSRAHYVVSSASVAERDASQLFFAALLAQRPLVGGRLCLALRHLRTLAGDPDFDHLRITRYPRPLALNALRTSPLLRALSPWQRRGVRALRASSAAVHILPPDWRMVRAAWVLLGDSATLAYDLHRALADQPALGSFYALSATLGPLPRSRVDAPAPASLPARELSVLAFPSVRLALDALETPEIIRLRSALGAELPSGGGRSWTLMERVSLREMLTPG